jgi:hypothetical protein
VLDGIALFFLNRGTSPISVASNENHNEFTGKAERHTGERTQATKHANLPSLKLGGVAYLTSLDS